MNTSIQSDERGKKMDSKRVYKFMCEKKVNLTYCNVVRVDVPFMSSIFGKHWHIKRVR